MKWLEWVLSYCLVHKIDDHSTPLLPILKPWVFVTIIIFWSHRVWLYLLSIFPWKILFSYFSPGIQWQWETNESHNGKLRWNWSKYGSHKDYLITLSASYLPWFESWQNWKRFNKTLSCWCIKERLPTRTLWTGETMLLSSLHKP